MDYRYWEGTGGMSRSSWDGNIGNVRKKIKDTGGYGVGNLGSLKNDQLSYDDTVASKNAAKSNYYDSDGKLKDGYISSTTKLGGFGDAVMSWDSRASADYDHMHSDEENVYLQYGHEGLHIYSNEKAPAPKAEPYKAPEQVGTSDKLANANQYLQNYTKSGKNFESNTLSDRQAKTDSFSQKPAYDPNAGVSGPEAGNFLDDYKLDLQKNIKDFRGQNTSNPTNPA